MLLIAAVPRRITPSFGQVTKRRIGSPLSAFHSQAASLENLAGKMNVYRDSQRGILSVGNGFDDVNDIPVESPCPIDSGKLKAAGKPAANPAATQAWDRCERLSVPESQPRAQ
jgi:hypothetical protein